MMQDIIFMILYWYVHLHVSRTVVHAQIRPVNFSWFWIAQMIAESFKECLPT